MNATRLPPIGFWSYARGDDEASRGRLSGLRSLLMSELQQHYGREPIKIFQDVAAIAPGADWEAEITGALDRSTFFIPIITPAFLESDFCCREVTLFLERERAIWRDFPAVRGRRRIFPIQYRAIDGVEAADRAVLAELRRIQWVDFLRLRIKPDTDEAVQSTLDETAGSICRLLQVRIDRAGTVEQDTSAASVPATNGISGLPATSTPVTTDEGATFGRALKWSIGGLLVLLVITVIAWSPRYREFGDNISTVAPATISKVAPGPVPIEAPQNGAPKTGVSTGTIASPQPSASVAPKARPTARPGNAKKDFVDDDSILDPKDIILPVDKIDGDAELWKATHDCAGIAEYLRKYPSGNFAKAAQAKQMSCM